MKKKTPTIKEIAKLAVVSPMTVSRARNNKPYVQFQAREKIAAIAKLTIDRDLKKALIDTTFDYISAHRYEYDPGKIDAQGNPAIQNRVVYWINMLGSATGARASPFF